MFVPRSRRQRSASSCSVVMSEGLVVSTVTCNAPSRPDVWHRLAITFRGLQHADLLDQQDGRSACAPAIPRLRLRQELLRRV